MNLNNQIEKVGKDVHSLLVSFFPHPPHLCPGFINEVTVVVRMEVIHGLNKLIHKSSLATKLVESAEINTIAEYDTILHKDQSDTGQQVR